MSEPVLSSVSVACMNPLWREGFYPRNLGFRRASVNPLSNEQIVFQPEQSVLKASVEGASR